jgi:hypothetical protein
VPEDAWDLGKKFFFEFRFATVKIILVIKIVQLGNNGGIDATGKIEANRYIAADAEFNGIFYKAFQFFLRSF